MNTRLRESIIVEELLTQSNRLQNQRPLQENTMTSKTESPETESWELRVRIVNSKRLAGLDFDCSITPDDLDFLLKWLSDRLGTSKNSPSGNRNDAPRASPSY